MSDWPVVEDTPDYMPPARGVGSPVGYSTGRARAELLANAIRDARIQMDTAMAKARLFRSPVGVSAEQAAGRAEREWRDKWPGLAALIDHADGA